MPGFQPVTRAELEEVIEARVSVAVAASGGWPASGLETANKLTALLDRLYASPPEVGVEFYRETDTDPSGPWQEVPSGDPRWSAEMEIETQVFYPEPATTPRTEPRIATMMLEAATNLDYMASQAAGHAKQLTLSDRLREEANRIEKIDLGVFYTDPKGARIERARRLCDAYHFALIWREADTPTIREALQRMRPPPGAGEQWFWQRVCEELDTYAWSSGGLRLTMTKSYLSGRQCCDFTIGKDDQEVHEEGCPWRLVDEFATWARAHLPRDRIRLMDRVDKLVEDITSSLVYHTARSTTPPAEISPQKLVVDFEAAVGAAVVAFAGDHNTRDDRAELYERVRKLRRELCARLQAS